MFGASTKTIQDYDAIGFDMDLCIARYKLWPFIQIMYESAAALLVRDYNYPHDIFPDDEAARELFSFTGRMVIDLKNMLALKLSGEGEVLRAFNGYSRLTNEEIIKEYGPEAKLSIPKLSELDFGKEYYFVSDHFKTDYGLIFIRIKELLKQKGKYPILESKTPIDILKDLRKTSDFNYHHFKEKYNPPEEFGFYFPMLRVNPKRFLRKMNPLVFERLRQLKETGKTIFLVTNSHVGYYDIIFPFITQDAPDAVEIFDYIGLNGGKPIFFDKVHRTPFYKVDYSKKDLRSPHDMNFSANKVFLEGNCHDFHDELKRRHNKENVKVIYFGDNSTGDMMCQNHPDWDGAFIYEELAEISPDLTTQPDYFDFTAKWGSWVRDTTVQGKEVDTLLMHFGKNKFSKTFSRVCSEECLDFFKAGQPSPNTPN